MRADPSAQMTVKVDEILSFRRIRRAMASVESADDQKERLVAAIRGSSVLRVNTGGSRVGRCSPVRQASREAPFGPNTVERGTAEFCSVLWQVPDDWPLPAVAARRPFMCKVMGLSRSRSPINGSAGDPNYVAEFRGLVDACEDGALIEWDKAVPRKPLSARVRLRAPIAP